MAFWLEITCRDCGEYFNGGMYRRGFPTKLKEKAVKYGWKYVKEDNDFICPDCQKKENGQ